VLLVTFFIAMCFSFVADRPEAHVRQGVYPKTEIIYSLLRASMGARWAARLAG
jgi:hypothetical protein